MEDLPKKVLILPLLPSESVGWKKYKLQVTWLKFVKNTWNLQKMWVEKCKLQYKYDTQDINFFACNFKL